MIISDAEAHIMEHATAFRHPRSPGYRNRYVAGPDTDAWPALQSLCARGLMRESMKPSELSGGDHVFAVTDLGMDVLRERFKHVETA